MLDIEDSENTRPNANWRSVNRLVFIGITTCYVSTDIPYSGTCSLAKYNAWVAVLKYSEYNQRYKSRAIRPCAAH